MTQDSVSNHVMYLVIVYRYFLLIWNNPSIICFFFFLEGEKTLMILIFLQCCFDQLCIIGLNLGIYMVCSWLNSGYAFQQEHDRVMCSSSCPKSGGTQSWCAPTLVALTEYLVKVVSARFLHLKITIFLFVISTESI